MAALRPTPRFEKSFARLGPEEKQRAAKSLAQFVGNPRHPHLHFEKLSTGYRTIRVDTNFRIVLREVESDLFDIIDVGNHTSMYKKYG